MQDIHYVVNTEYANMSSTRDFGHSANDEMDQTAVSVLEKSLAALHMNNNNDGSTTSKDTTAYARPPLGRVTSLEDVLEEDLHGETYSPLRNRPSRSPRRRLDEEQHPTFSCSQSSLARLRNRRRSDPGKISVSPLRTRLRIDNISEDGDYDNRNMSIAASRLPVRRSSSLDPTEIDEALPVMYGIRSRSRSPHTQVKLRTQRSRSLPGIEFELGEAIGALAVRQSPFLTDQNRIPIRRRRSVSVETPAPLEAILEENAAGQRSSRRFSTPSVESPTAL